MNKLLFPHWVQRVSLAVIILDLIAVITMLVMSLYHDASAVTKTWQAIMVIILYLAFFCCVFSREKREDEYISRMRLQSVAIVAFIAFLFVIILNIIQVLLPLDDYKTFREWRKETFWNGRLIVDMALLYLIIFKLKIRK